MNEWSTPGEGRDTERGTEEGAGSGAEDCATWREGQGADDPMVEQGERRRRRQTIGDCDDNDRATCAAKVDKQEEPGRGWRRTHEVVGCGAATPIGPPQQRVAHQAGENDSVDSLEGGDSIFTNRCPSLATGRCDDANDEKESMVWRDSIARCSGQVVRVEEGVAGEGRGKDDSEGANLRPSGRVDDGCSEGDGGEKGYVDMLVRGLGSASEDETVWFGVNVPNKVFLPLPRLFSRSAQPENVRALKLRQGHLWP